MKLYILLFTAFFYLPSNAQKIKYTDAPKLVVGIVVDQMRYDYITRFYDDYGSGGFKRILDKGFNCKNNHIPYLPTTTAPGHASIYTGTTPSYHGIIGNFWYEESSGERVYSVYDPKVASIGTGARDAKSSPLHLKVSTIGDQLKLHTQGKSKVISIAIKDRAAVLSGGHSGSAYWFRGKKQGSWVSSSYYSNRLPKWVLDFNENTLIDDYLSKWAKLNPEEELPDQKNHDDYERGFKGLNQKELSYSLDSLRIKNGNYDLLKSTPFGNTITTDFAIEAIKKEFLGKDEFPDLLAISYSSTDYIGHNFGVNSDEVRDTYLRLDLELEKLIDFLDTEIGKNKYTLFLTADHGAVPVPGYLNSLKIPAQYFKEASFYRDVQNFVAKQYGSTALISGFSNQQFYFNRKEIEKRSLDFFQVVEKVKMYISQYDQIDKVYTRKQLTYVSEAQKDLYRVQLGFHPKRSGDLMYLLEPATVSYAKTGSTHGSGFAYDTHVPLLFYGKGIKQGYLFKRTEVIDIAPTIAILLGTSLPNSSIGKVISKVLNEE